MTPRKPGFYWARFPTYTDKDWTVVQIHEDGTADVVGWDGGVDPMDAEWGPRIEPPVNTP